MSATGSCLAAAVKTFGALPFASMIPTFQCPGLRKHPGVGLDDPLQTSARYRAPWSTQPAYCLAGSALQGGVVDLSQAVFATVLNTSVSTVQKWEVGDKKPSGPSLKLLNLIERKGLEAVL